MRESTRNESSYFANLNERLWYAGYVALSTVLVIAIGMAHLLSGQWRRMLSCFGYGSWSFQPKGALWFHGASLGELAGVQPVLQAFRPSQEKVIVSSTSRLGQEEIVRRGLGDRPVFFCYDHPLIWRRLLRRVAPTHVFIAETELWPALARSLAQHNIPTFLFNARISDRTFPRYQRFHLLFAPVLRGFRGICSQTERDASRLRAVGADEAGMKITGSTKYSQRVEQRAEQIARLRTELRMLPEMQVVVVGSTRPGEEQLILSALLPLFAENLLLKAVIAPRHKERFDEVESLLRSLQVSFGRRSQGSTFLESQVLLLDTHGELQSVYGLAQLAFVGGSLANFGGHNPIEAAAFGVPVLYGPYSQNFHDIVEELKAAGGIVPVADAADLQVQLRSLLADANLRQVIGSEARRVAERQFSALPRTVDFLQSRM